MEPNFKLNLTPKAMFQHKNAGKILFIKLKVSYIYINWVSKKKSFKQYLVITEWPLEKTFSK